MWARNRAIVQFQKPSIVRFGKDNLQTMGVAVALRDIFNILEELRGDIWRMSLLQIRNKGLWKYEDFTFLKNVNIALHLAN